jgi:hypothetical protein
LTPGFVNKRCESESTVHEKVTIGLAKFSHIFVPLWVYFSTVLEYQIGKVGTDMMDNKCLTCINMALAHANDVQQAILQLQQHGY